MTLFSKLSYLQFIRSKINTMSVVKAEFSIKLKYMQEGMVTHSFLFSQQLGSSLVLSRDSENVG